MYFYGFLPYSTYATKFLEIIRRLKETSLRNWEALFFENPLTVDIKEIQEKYFDDEIKMMEHLQTVLTVGLTMSLMIFIIVLTMPLIELKILSYKTIEPKIDMEEKTDDNIAEPITLLEEDKNYRSIQLQGKRIPRSKKVQNHTSRYPLSHKVIPIWKDQDFKCLNSFHLHAKNDYLIDKDEDDKTLHAIDEEETAGDEKNENDDRFRYLFGEKVTPTWKCEVGKSIHGLHTSVLPVEQYNSDEFGYLFKKKVSLADEYEDEISLQSISERILLGEKYKFQFSPGKKVLEIEKDNKNDSHV